jgi:hypothetical protein
LIDAWAVSDDSPGYYSNADFGTLALTRDMSMLNAERDELGVHWCRGPEQMQVLCSLPQPAYAKVDLEVAPFD